MVFGEVFGDVWGTPGSSQGSSTTFTRENISQTGNEDNSYLSGVDDFLFDSVMSSNSVGSGVVSPSNRLGETEAHLRATASSSTAYSTAYHPKPPTQTWETVAEAGENLVMKWSNEIDKAESLFPAQGWATTSPAVAQPEKITTDVVEPVEDQSFVEKLGDASLNTFKLISPLNVKYKVDFYKNIFKQDIEPGEGETTVGDGLKDLFGIDDLNLGKILPTAGITTVVIAGAALFLLGPALMRRF